MGYVERAIGEGDLELVVRHRAEMFRDAGRAEEILAAMEGPFRSWLAPRLADGRYFGWVTESEGAPVAGLGMMVIDWPPHPSHPTQDARGYVLNIYVELEHRRRGLARTLMARATQEGETRGLDHLVLHATEKGRSLYEKLGWRGTTEMALSLRKPKP